jgi:hypothetical protein
MFVTTLTSTALTLRQNLWQHNWVLAAACLILLGLAAGMIVLAVQVFRRPPVALEEEGLAAAPATGVSPNC